MNFEEDKEPIGKFYHCTMEHCAHVIFWIDPEEEIVAILMTQYLPPNNTLRQDMRSLVYQALEE